MHAQPSGTDITSWGKPSVEKGEKAREQKVNEKSNFLLLADLGEKRSRMLYGSRPDAKNEAIDDSRAINQRLPEARGERMGVCDSFVELSRKKQCS
jgi:hypothetical protein